MRKNKNLPLSLACLFLTLSLGACGSKVEQAPMLLKAVDSMAGKRVERNARMDTAAAEAMAAGHYAEAARSYEKIYDSRFFRTQDLAVKYAMALRKSGQPEKVKEVLSPYLRSIRSDSSLSGVSSALLNEYAAASIALEKFDEAEKPLESVLDNKEDKAFHAEAAHMMGIVLNARGEYKKSTPLFQRALKDWQGNKAPVMGSMAISLAHQGKTGDALDMLGKALLIATDKEDIARKIETVHEIKACKTEKPAKKMCGKKT